MASGAIAARVAEWQFLLIPVSVSSLALGHCLAYRRGAGGRWQRILLWTVTPISLTLWALPHVLR